MKIYCARQNYSNMSDLEILESIAGKDIWIKIIWNDGFPEEYFQILDFKDDGFHYPTIDYHSISASLVEEGGKTMLTKDMLLGTTHRGNAVEPQKSYDRGFTIVRPIDIITTAEILDMYNLARIHA